MKKSRLKSNENSFDYSSPPTYFVNFPLIEWLSSRLSSPNFKKNDPQWIAKPNFFETTLWENEIRKGELFPLFSLGLKQQLNVRKRKLHIKRGISPFFPSWTIKESGKPIFFINEEIYSEGNGTPLILSSPQSKEIARILVPLTLFPKKTVKVWIKGKDPFSPLEWLGILFALISPRKYVFWGRV